MTRRTPHLPARGSALVLVVILLAAMATISVAIVRLSGQARIRAAAQSSHDALTECANAAKAMLWSALAVNGKSYYLTPSTAITVTSLKLPDGKELYAPAHLNSGSTVASTDVIRHVVASSPGGFFGTGDDDTTNRLWVGAGRGSGDGSSATWIVARCTDASGRVHEIEFAFRFSL